MLSTKIDYLTKALSSGIMQALRQAVQEATEQACREVLGRPSLHFPAPVAAKTAKASQKPLTSFLRASDGAYHLHLSNGKVVKVITRSRLRDLRYLAKKRYGIILL